MPEMFGDFETRSTVDLRVAGVDVYTKHPTTEPWCFGFAFGNEEPELWTLGQKCPDKVANHIRKGGICWFHNVGFDVKIHNEICVPRFDWPPLAIEQVRCSMAACYAMALPGSLENAAAALGLEQQKDMVGHRLIRQMMKPRSINPDGTIVWWDEPEKLIRGGEYCLQDLRTMREMIGRLMPLSDYEQKVWEADQRINNRGVYVDLPAVKAAVKIVQAEQDKLNLEMRRVTGNFVGFCTEVARLGQWIRTRGVDMPSVAKAAVLDALEDENLPPEVREALLLRQQAGKTSTAKLQAMLAATSSDGRLRGMFQYHGAGTGRWAGRRVQLQNLPRPKIGHAEMEKVFEVLR